MSGEIEDFVVTDPMLRRAMIDPGVAVQSFTVVCEITWPSSIDGPTPGDESREVVVDAKSTSQATLAAMRFFGDAKVEVIGVVHGRR